MSWYLTVLKKYAVFEGRSRRKEYWMFILVNFIISMVLFTLESMIYEVPVIYWIYLLAVLLPSIAVTIRRFHDQDKSGWFVLLGLIPAVGGIILLVFMCLDGTPGPNRFGESPKQVGGEEAPPAMA